MSTEDMKQDQIAELLRQVGPRPSVPAERKERVRQAVHSEWSRTIRGRHRRQFIWGSSAVAAGIASVLLLTPTVRDHLRSYLTAPAQATTVGTVVAVRGLVWHAPPGTAESLPLMALFS